MCSTPQRPPTHSDRIKYDFRKINEILVNHDWSPLFSLSIAEEAAQLVNNVVLAAIHTNCRVAAKRRYTSNNQSWATREFLDLLSERDRAHKSWILCPLNVHLRRRYVLLRNKVTSVKRNLKRSFYKERVSNDLGQGKSLWNVVNG